MGNKFTYWMFKSSTKWTNFLGLLSYSLTGKLQTREDLPRSSSEYPTSYNRETEN
jgi:hypothetical protein